MSNDDYNTYLDPSLSQAALAHDTPPRGFEADRNALRSRQDALAQQLRTGPPPSKHPLIAAIEARDAAREAMVKAREALLKAQAELTARLAEFDASEQEANHA